MHCNRGYLTATLLTLAFTFGSMGHADTGPLLITTETLYSGFGAEFSAVVGSLHFYEQGNYAGLKVDLTSGLYLDPYPAGPNWWEYYFDPILLGNQSHPDTHTFDQAESIAISQTAFHLPRERIFELIQKYVRVKEPIQNEVNAFYDRYFDDHFVIGVHHRGTDKIMEVSIVPYERTLKILMQIISQLSPKQIQKLRIFVASDDQNFVDYLHAHFPLIVVSNDFVRSSDNNPLHYGPTRYANNYQKGKEALVDCLLLSKCHLLVRPGPSAFSWLAMVFNPYLPIVTL